MQSSPQIVPGPAREPHGKASPIAFLPGPAGPRPFTHVNGGTGAQTASAALINYTLMGATAGNLVVVGLTALVGTTTTFSISDGTNTDTADANKFENGDTILIFHSVITTGGNLTIVITPSVSCAMGMGVDEYNFPAGALIALDGVVGTGGGSGTSQTTGNLVPLPRASYRVTSGVANNIGTSTAGSGFKAGYNYSRATSSHSPILCEDILTNTTSPIAVTSTSSASASWSIVGVAFKATVPPIYPVPSNLPADHAGPITVNLGGTGTTWTQGGRHSRSAATPRWRARPP